MLKAKKLEIIIIHEASTKANRNVVHKNNKKHQQLTMSIYKDKNSNNN